MTILAQTITKADLIDAFKEVMSGTPDAARSEPFTWIMGLLIVGLVIVVMLFGRRVGLDIMHFIKGLTDQQKTMADECHRTQKESLRTVTEAASACSQALIIHAEATRDHTAVMERVIQRLGHP